MISKDDHIGTTVIDLEDRWFDERWKSMGSEALEQDKRLRTMQVCCPRSCGVCPWPVSRLRCLPLA